MELAEFDKSVVEFSIKELMGNGNSLPLMKLCSKKRSFNIKCAY